MSLSAELIDEILKHELVLPDLNPFAEQTRVQDDCDGDISDSVSVKIDACGDVYIAFNKPGMKRFRTVAGGGESPRTHNALKILAEAIRLDNLERGVQRSSSADLSTE